MAHQILNRFLKTYSKLLLDWSTQKLTKIVLQKNFLRNAPMGTLHAGPIEDYSKIA